jgi:hypothetical protein
VVSPFHPAERSGQHEVVEVAEVPDTKDFALNLAETGGSMVLEEGVEPSYPVKDAGF